MKKYFCILILLAAAPAHSATYTATSCSSSDVSAAINSSANGDTVRIPAGNCTWSNTISTNKGISIIGAGQGQTNITGQGFVMSAPDGLSWRLSGMTLKGTTGIEVTSTSKAFRIDHITFDNVTGRPSSRIIWIQESGSGYAQGVIDHNTFTNPKSIQIHHRPESSSHGNASWKRPLGLGGADAIYVEDNQFNHATPNVSAPVNDCEGGGRMVFRHNSVTNAYFQMHDAIVSGWRGCRKWEVYENTFNATTTGLCVFMGIRGGTGVVYNNIFTGTADCHPQLITLHVYRTYQTAGQPWGSLCSASSGKACLNNVTGEILYNCSSDADCGGGSGACIAIDGGSASPSGYPCRDQHGVDGNNPQVSKPSLFWNNKHGGTFIHPVVHSQTKSAYLVQGRDYCTGTTSRPESCNGVVSTYTAYTYPHPLVSGTAAPNPPSDVEVTSP